MTVKLDLVDGIWVEIGAIAFIIDKTRKVNVEIACADELPVGVVACHYNRRDDLQHFPRPANGSWYARSVGINNSITYTEV